MTGHRALAEGHRDRPGRAPGGRGQSLQVASSPGPQGLRGMNGGRLGRESCQFKTKRAFNFLKTQIFTQY